MKTDCVENTLAVGGVQGDARRVKDIDTSTVLENPWDQRLIDNSCDLLTMVIVNACLSLRRHVRWDLHRPVKLHKFMMQGSEIGQQTTG